MKLFSDKINDYLERTNIIDYNSENIQNLINQFKTRDLDESELVKQVFEYVRDNIGHSADILGDYVTCKASDVLKHKEGICYAKAHLLAAVLRGLGIPTGFCYQRLILNDETAPYLILHGLNGVYLNSIDKWIRLDSRGNKPEVNAQFSLDEEKLAFDVRAELGEEDILVIYPEPDDSILQVLTEYQTVEELFANLPTELVNR